VTQADADGSDAVQKAAVSLRLFALMGFKAADRLNHLCGPLVRNRPNKNVLGNVRDPAQLRIQCAKSREEARRL
jgi:hypothetical protein